MISTDRVEFGLEEVHTKRETSHLQPLTSFTVQNNVRKKQVFTTSMTNVIDLRTTLSILCVEISKGEKKILCDCYGNTKVGQHSPT